MKKAKEKAGIKILNNINKEEKLPELFKYDIMASDIYNLLPGVVVLETRRKAFCLLCWYELAAVCPFMTRRDPRLST